MPVPVGAVKYFSQKHLCQNEVQRRKVRRGLPSPAYLPCSVFRRRCQGCRFSGIHRSDRLRSRRPLTASTAYATLALFMPLQWWSGISYIDTALIPNPFPTRTAIWHKPTSAQTSRPEKYRQGGCVSESHGSCAQ